MLLHSDRAQWNRQGIYGVHRCSLVGLTIDLVQSFAFHLQFHLRILFEDLRVALTKHLLTLENRIVADFAAAPLRWYIWVTVPWRVGARSDCSGKLFKIVAGCLRDFRPFRMGLEGDGRAMSGHDSLAKRLCQVSSYADRVEPFIGLIPDIMERNDQLRPLWTAWQQNATPDLTPQQYFTRSEIKLLRDFVAYLYFASDAFARSARTGR